MRHVRQPLTRGGRNPTDTRSKFSNSRATLLFRSGPIPQTLFKAGFRSTNRTSTALLDGSLRPEQACPIFLPGTQYSEQVEWRHKTTQLAWIISQDKHRHAV